MPYYPPAGGGGGGGGALVPASMDQSLTSKVRPGFFYSFPNTGALGSLGLVNGNAYVVPFGVPKAIADMTGKVRIQVTAAGAGGSLVYAAIYKCDETMSLTEQVSDVGAIDAATTGVKEFGTPFPLDAAGYYAVTLATFTYTGISVRNIDCAGGASVPSSADPLGQPNLLGNGFVAGSITAWPATWPAALPGPTAFAPRVAMHFKSVW